MKTFQSELSRLKDERVENEKRASEYTGPRKVFTHLGEKKEVTAPWMTDEEVAGRVRMLMRDDMDHESVCVLARDRILHLSQYMERKYSLLVHDTHDGGFGVSLMMDNAEGQLTAGFILMSTQDMNERDKYAKELGEVMNLKTETL